jgi:hypothetical protein
VNEHCLAGLLASGSSGLSVPSRCYSAQQWHSGIERSSPVTAAQPLPNGLFVRNARHSLFSPGEPGHLAMDCQGRKDNT